MPPERMSLQKKLTMSGGFGVWLKRARTTELHSTGQILHAHKTSCRDAIINFTLRFQSTCTHQHSTSPVHENFFAPSPERAAHGSLPHHNHDPDREFIACYITTPAAHKHALVCNASRPCRVHAQAKHPWPVSIWIGSDAKRMLGARSRPADTSDGGRGHERRTTHPSAAALENCVCPCS